MRPLEVDTVALRGTQLVEASAGTGKTFAIAHLFLRLLIEPEGRAQLEPRDVLVVTYTKAATAELRARIRARLRQALAALRGAQPRDAALSSLVARRRAAGQAGDDAEHLENCLRSLDQAAIHTIHAFCQRALGDAAFRSGADFDVELLEDARPLLREIARDFWVSRLAEAPEGFVAFLHEHKQHKLGIDALVRLAERITAQPHAQILPEQTGTVPVPETPAAWHAALRDVQQLWPRARAEVRALLVDSGAMYGNIYKAASVDRWLDDLDLELMRPRPGISWRIELHRLESGYIREKTRARCAAPEHPLFAACARLLAVEQTLERELAACALSLRLDFASRVRGELAVRLRAAGLQGFDDLLLGLQRALRAEDGAELASALVLRHPVALIDESQDTDPVQYEIFKRIWHAAGAPLFLIGDPKQAIYSFRGADVQAYLSARADAESSFTLDVSRRSDPSLVDAINALFRGQDDPFDLPGLEYLALERRPGSIDALGAPAFELLVADAPARVAAGVAAEIAQLLAHPPALGAGRLGASDIAVLCRTNDQARDVRDELHLRGVAAVLQGDASVFHTEASEDVERIARALAHPDDARRLRAALATPLLGVGARELEAMAGGDSGWETWQERMRGARETWGGLGFSVALRALLDAAGGTGRLLGEIGGERRLTDALQLGELMHLAERKLHLGPLGLVRWLAAARAGALARGAADWIEDAQIRLESDGDAVRLTTVHRSKGLEYGIVYVPFAWKGDDLRRDEKQFVRFHRGDGEIAFDLGCAEPGRAANLAAAESEAGSEAMRLLYVALTRARHGCRVVYAAGGQSHETALGRLLRAQKDESPEALVRRLPMLGARGLAPSAPVIRLPAAAAAPVGAPRVLERSLGLARRTSSYTGLVRRARAGSLGRDHDAEVAAGDGPELARGASVGLALHEVLEHLDFPAAEPDGVRRAVERASALHGVERESADALVRVVLDTLDAPLPPDGAFRLRDVMRAERTSELEFLLPAGDARSDASRLTPALLAGAFAQHADPDLREYASRLRRLDFAPLVGHLRGFVDLVIRKRGRWYLLDYKSNHLPDYSQERLRAAMLEHHYVLQYHLYALALHRWLARRVPDYAYERDFGGAQYLFVRGMSPARPTGSGVWFDRPPLALIEALGRALARAGEAR